ncbi:UDP-glucose:glycoprotein glucosyltransferase-domain-containing protein [Phyllosticta capitalensis]|uniref:UDP-glucose:glycoprotein glucosyltransferase-domain-containing protein n=1 Tax=Phyllosticta capitalensis TaxID=121624 RepID=A0ABR1YE69_9PEZI
MRIPTWLLSGHIPLLLGALGARCASASPPINVALRASFPSPPYLVELLETAAEENATAYYPLLDRIADGYFDGKKTERELFDAFLKLLQDDGHITDSVALSSFQFALSIHSAAPRIEAHYQFYNTSVEPSLQAAQGEDCEVWALQNGKQFCSPEMAKEHGAVREPRTDDLPFDRILNTAENQVPTIVYADITSSKFRAFHKTVAKSTKEGKSSYKLRHKAPREGDRRLLPITGYGVQLALKRTDYIVIDDREAEEAGHEAAAAPAQNSLQDEEVADLKPLSESELKGLGLKAGSFVMQSEDPLDTLVRLVQDFPKHSSAIAAHNITKQFLKEHRGNREAILPSGYNILWINGVQIMPRSMDAFALLEHLRKERQIINGVKRLGFNAPSAISVLSHNAISKAKDSDETQRYDWRDDTEGGHVIMWLNNIEKDKRYAEWPSSLKALLQPSYPGTLPQVRRDIQRTVVPLDFSEHKDVALVVETLQTMTKRGLAMQWGLVPVTHSPAAAEQAKVVYHLLETHGLAAVFKYLEGSLKARQLSTPHKATYESVTKDAKVRRDRVPRSLQEVLKHEDATSRIEATTKWLTRLGAEGATPPLFVNGVALPRNDEWLPTMSMRVTQDLQMIQKRVFEEELDDDTWIPGVFLESASLRRNPLVVPEDEKALKFIDMAQFNVEHGMSISKLPTIPVAEDSRWFQWAQLIVLGDFDSEAGTRLLVDAIQFRQDHEDVEVVFVHTGTSSEPKLSSKLLKLVDQGKTPTMDDISNADDVEAADFSKYAARWTETHQLARALGCEPGQECLVLNGRTVGPIPRKKTFTKDDFETLLTYERQKRIEPAARAVKDLELSDKITSPGGSAQFSSLVALSTVSDVPEGIFDAPPTMRRDVFKFWNDTHTAIKTGDAETATIQIVASIDPSSETAQRWIPILKVLSEMSGVHMRLFLNPKERLDELPIKRFYRYVLSSQPEFEDDGSTKSLQAHFSGIPSEALLTIGMDVPPSWVVAPKECIQDLDNIKLSQVKGQTPINAVYELEYILIEGHSRDITNGMYPRGVQLDLRTASNPRYADTIIMSNLGYFQFKANPGFFNIELQPGRSQEIFTIDSAGTLGWNPTAGDETKDIALMSFQGVTLYPRFSRKAGMEDEDVLSAPTSLADELAEKGAKLADGLLSKVGLGNVKTGKTFSRGLEYASQLGLASDKGAALQQQQQHADINIFSVASGHLYERMLNIMMVSVMKHTNHSVKFWFIEQFLSPSFKSFLPHLAAEYGFQYEMVTYKWPHWLRGQKEKQREIWGYKILFLDVLFPLSLDKIIFVDADQVVRTDLYDLVTTDLQGAPYGFTPMCDSRHEMEGFRFWKQGYWKNYLRGRPYHISALYVVDLARFRRLAAGDRLRQQYQALSADPNSLSNLDQDLPNNMQAQLPIFSLDQDWLWCETWCDDDSLSRARTIDLCNNPQTKEPKLDRARRQLPEWSVYDDEIRGVAMKVKGVGKEEAEVVVGAGGGAGTLDKGGEGEKASEEQTEKEEEEEEERIRDEL